MDCGAHFFLFGQVDDRNYDLIQTYFDCFNELTSLPDLSQEQSPSKSIPIKCFHQQILPCCLLPSVSAVSGISTGRKSKWRRILPELTVRWSLISINDRLIRFFSISSTICFLSLIMKFQVYLAQILIKLWRVHWTDSFPRQSLIPKASTLWKN